MTKVNAAERCASFILCVVLHLSYYLMVMGYVRCAGEMLAAISTTRYLRGQCSTVSLLELLGLQDCERLDLSHSVTGKLKNLMECCSSNIQIW